MNDSENRRTAWSSWGGPVSVAGEVVGKVTKKGRKHLVPKNEGVGDNNLCGGHWQP